MTANPIAGDNSMSVYHYNDPDSDNHRAPKQTTTTASVAAESTAAAACAAVPFYEGLGADYKFIIQKSHPKGMRFSIGGALDGPIKSGFRAELKQPKDTELFNKDPRWAGNINIGADLGNGFTFKVHSMAGPDSALPRPAHNCPLSKRPWAHYGEARIEEKGPGKIPFTAQFRSGQIRSVVGDNTPGLLAKLRTHWSPYFATDTRIIANKNSILAKLATTWGTDDGLSAGIFAERDLLDANGRLDIGTALQWRSTNGSTLGGKFTNFGSTYFGTHTFYGDRKTREYTQCAFEWQRNSGSDSKLTLGTSTSIPVGADAALMSAFKASSNGELSATGQFNYPLQQNYVSLLLKPNPANHERPIATYSPHLSVGVTLGDYS